MTRMTKLLIPLFLLVAASAALLVWFLGGDTPAEVDLDAATEIVTDRSGGSSNAAEVDGTPGTDDLDGGWVVDTDTGDFDYESATGSFVGFRIDEELAGIGATTAVGRTGDVTGGLTIDGMSIVDVAFDIDLTTITTDDSRRDDNVQDALETGDFPTASFVLTEPIAVSEAALSGEAMSATAVGDLTIHGVTNAVAFPLEARLVEETIVVVGSTDIVFADYGVSVPDSQIIVSVEDVGVLELQLLLTRA